MLSVRMAIFFCTIVYMTTGILGLYSFGSSIESNVLDNIGTESSHWVSYLLRVVFLLVLGCHIPFFFYIAKESTLIIIDELNRESITKQMKQIEKEVSEGSFVPSEEGRPMPYKNMSNTIYYPVSVLIFVIVMLGAIFLENIGVIFQYISAVSVSCQSFIFPGVFYLLGK
jgi:amino acid permease